jgi:hypothetical protein
MKYNSGCNVLGMCTYNWVPIRSRSPIGFKSAGSVHQVTWATKFSTVACTNFKVADGIFWKNTWIPWRPVLRLRLIPQGHTHLSLSLRGTCDHPQATSQWQYNYKMQYKSKQHTSQNSSSMSPCTALRHTTKWRYNSVDVDWGRGHGATTPLHLGL